MIALPGLFTGTLVPPSDEQACSVYEFPCSGAQRRFWILDRLQPGAPWLNIAVWWRLEGRIEPGLVEQAFAALVRRHEILRTGLVEIDGEPRQRVAPALPVELPWIDLSHLTPAEREAEAARIALNIARRPFALEVPPLLRGCLLKLDDRESRLVLALHHIVADGWSIGIIARELADLYEVALGHRAAPTPPDLQYADIVLWEGERQATGPGEGRRYWEQRLKGLEPFELLTDRPRPALRTGEGRIESRLLPIFLTDAATQWTNDRGATFFTLSLATLGSVLHRYGGQREIVVGTQVAGRSREEMEPVIGPFLNTLVLRIDAGGDPAFAILFERAREAVEGALAHADTPFEDLVDIVRPARATGQSPLFQVNLIHQRSFVADQRRRDFALLDMPSLSPGALYDLNFFMVERAEGWRLSCEYDTDLFEADTIRRFLAQFEAVLTAAIEAPQRTIGDLTIASADDRARILAWNDTARAVPFTTVPALIQAQVRRTPQFRAVLSGEDSLTFAELERQANRLAHLLIARGVRPADLVGVCLDRSVMLPVALLAVLKAGAAYVPLDPDYPAIRLGQMAEDARLSALLTTGELTGRVPALGEARILIDAEDAALAATLDHDPGVGRSGEDIAYVLFTSGSTGRPKGVEIPHRALANLLAAMQRSLGLAAHDVLAAVTSPSFDIAALELFLPLVAGARLVIARRQETQDGEALLRLLRRSTATTLQATPTTFRMLLETAWNGVPRLRMLCGGEALPRDLATRLMPYGELWNMYGPTETTIWSSALPVQGGVGPIPLGGPIANTRFEVLDDALRPVPLGAPGELLIGGAGVARGYLGRPDLTGERFVRPRDPAIGGRLYRTGDLVRWRTDGTLEFLGRLDQQVKLRGFRLELGEIEAALSADPAVVGAVAAVQPGTSGEQRLVAFFVPRDPAADGAALAARLHETAAATLPAFMRPAAILPLAALPRTPNGKIDRRALPPADAAQSAGPARPFDATEQRLARLWRELLGPVKIAPESDFFGLGGDSLAASRLISRLQREFGRSLSFASLFEDATFARIARMVGGRGAEEQDPRIVVLRRGRAPRPLWGISTTTIFRKLAGRLALDLPFYVVRAQESELDAILACRTVEAIAGYYLAALRRVQPAGPYALLGFCAEAVVAFEMARQLEHQGETVDVLVLIDAWAPGYLARMRPLRARLANLLYNTIRLLNGLGMALRTGRLGSLAVDLPPPPDPEDGPTAPALIHGHLAACAARYRPGPFGGRALVARSAVQPSGPLLDRDLGWARLVRGGVELVTVPGDHLGIFAEPGVDVLATGITGFARTNLQEGPLP